MRTRRSPRNQEILWRELGKSPEVRDNPAKPGEPETLEMAISRLERLLQDPFVSRRDKAAYARELEKCQLRLKVKANLAEEKNGSQ